MNLTKPPRLSTVVYVVSLRAPDTKIRFKQAEIEAAYAGLVPGQSQQTNVPDNADPSQPRIIFANDKKSLAFSQVSFQLQLNFSDSSASLVDQLKAVKKNLNEFRQRTAAFLPDTSLGTSGFVVDLLLSSTHLDNDLQQYIFDTYYKIKPLGKIASAQFSVGFEIGEFFLSISANPYEQRKLDFNNSTSAQDVPIHISKMPVIERGLAFKFDVNDKPRQINTPGIFSPPENLFDIMEDFLNTQFKNFSGLSY